ncbi:hypothetical protein [Jannaschia sp. CCS1]|uniref:hypothetical protein n=1 Tax=Jannaschia sp. (strain CCS1) TaxID=290400 RepID=UPI00140F7CE6|nr:hypothetical protein [Jannaschia sp. CCS1]
MNFLKLAVLASALSMAGWVGDAAAQGLRNPCPAAWAGDGDCDEPNGLNLCAWGTDPVDCSNPNSYFGSGAGFAAGAYTSPTPTPTPVPTPVPAQACPYTNDGDCDEPNGLNLCAWGSDPVDCSNPNSNYGRGAGFNAGIYAQTQPAPTPVPVPVPTPVPGGNMTAISQGAFVHGGGGGYTGCPNYTIGNTAFGQATMYGGQGSYRVPRITAGGRYPLTNCFPGTNWRGFTITRPDFRFFYQGNSPTGRLTFQLSSNAVDTVLLINTPDGRWYFNDDSNGTFNSLLTFSPVLQGQYDIWAGAYNNSSNNPADLWIYE